MTTTKHEPNTTEVSYLVASSRGHTSLFQVVNHYGSTGNNRGAEQHPIHTISRRQAGADGLTTLVTGMHLPWWIRQRLVSAAQSREIGRALIRHALNPCKCRQSFQTTTETYR